MRKYDYSNEIAKVVKQFLDNNEWHYFFDENTGVFEFNLNIKSKIKKIEYLINVNKDEIIVYGICPIGVDCENLEMMTQMTEFICRANYGLKNGCFEINFKDGEICFRSYIDCDNLIPSEEVIKNSICYIYIVFKRYVPGIIDIIFSGCNAKTAVEKCEIVTEKEELHSLLEDIIEEEINNSDTDVSSKIRVNPFSDKKEGGIS